MVTSWAEYFPNINNYLKHKKAEPGKTRPCFKHKLNQQIILIAELLFQPFQVTSLALYLSHLWLPVQPVC